MAISRLGEPEIRTVFYFAVGTAVAGAAGMALIIVSAIAIAAPVLRARAMPGTPAEEH